MRRPRKLHQYSLTIGLLFLAGCAGQIAPSGGPPDTTPPTIIATVPDSNAIHVKDNSIGLEFSEYVDRRTVEESIFISPYVGELEFDWGSTDVTVRFGQKLKENTTYVVNVGTDIKDLRAGNRMAAGYTLAFSTGDSIDRGLISGRVFDEKPEGVMIFAYALKNYNPDTLDPSREKPDYIMQTGKDGKFRLSNIAFGRYRVIAVRDEYHNLVYDKQLDQFGVPVSDTAVTAEQPGVSDLWFRLSQEDTTGPFVTAAVPLNDRHLQVRLSEPPDSVSFADARFSVVDTLTLKPVPLVLVSRGRVVPTVVDLITQGKLDSGAAYRVTVRKVFDRAGNPMDTANASVVFTGTANPDTIRPVPHVHGITDSAKGIPLGQIPEIAFSEPVLHEPVEMGVTFLDSGKAVVPTSLRWMNATDMQLVPGKPLESNEWYQIRLIMDSVRDYSGNTWKDSTMVVRFQSLDLRTTGTIEGVVSDPWGDLGRGVIYLTASSIDLTPARERTIRMHSPGAFALDQLPEGNYVLSAFRDSDSSGTYSCGRPFPFLPSERFTVGTDTVKVRARWGVEGVALKFR